MIKNSTDIIKLERFILWGSTLSEKYEQAVYAGERPNDPRRWMARLLH